MEKGKARRNAVIDLALIVVGALVYAIGLDCFEVPNGLAAGGTVGLSTIISKVVLDTRGFRIPIGALNLSMNALLMVPVYRSGGWRYALRTVMGIAAAALFTDLLAPVMPVLGNEDYLLCAIWGGAICGFGMSLVYLAGSNTGGSSIVSRFVASRTSLSIGMAGMIIDMAVVVLSSTVFGLDRALYASVCMYIGSKVIDVVVDGGKARRAAYVISAHPDEIERAVKQELGHSCTRIIAEQGRRRNVIPVLLVVLGRSELGPLRGIVFAEDPHANLVVTSVTETFGEGLAAR